MSCNYCFKICQSRVGNLRYNQELRCPRRIHWPLALRKKRLQPLGSQLEPGACVGGGFEMLTHVSSWWGVAQATRTQDSLCCVLFWDSHGKPERSGAGGSRQNTMLPEQNVMLQGTSMRFGYCLLNVCSTLQHYAIRWNRWRCLSQWGLRWCCDVWVPQRDLLVPEEETVCMPSFSCDTSGQVLQRSCRARHLLLLIAGASCLFCSHGI